jgi:adenylate cyclase
LGKKALALDDSLPSTYSLLGSTSLALGEHDKAIAYHEKAVALEPSGADGTAMLAWALTYAGKPTEAAALLEKAMRLSPNYPPWYLSALGSAYRLAGRYDDAVAALERAEARNPQNLNTRAMLAVIYSESGRRPEARATTSAILELDPEFTIETYAHAIPYKDPAELVRISDALRDAGLPE